MIVPPSAIIPSVLLRSSTTKSPGGSRPSKPSRKPITSQPSFSPARTTPRNTAFRPGQSPPLVRTPIRVFMSKTQSKHFLRIDKPSAGGPLIVKLPALANQLAAFSKPAIAAEQNNDDASRKNPHALSFFHDIRLARSGKNETFT